MYLARGSSQLRGTFAAAAPYTAEVGHESEQPQAGENERSRDPTPLCRGRLARRSVWAPESNSTRMPKQQPATTATSEMARAVSG